MIKDDGGHAFPMTMNHLKGMTLRDYFAAQALTGIMAHNYASAGQWATAAKNAYRAADAFIAQRGDS